MIEVCVEQAVPVPIQPWGWAWGDWRQVGNDWVLSVAEVQAVLSVWGRWLGVLNAPLHLSAYVVVVRASGVLLGRGEWAWDNASRCYRPVMHLVSVV